MPNYCFDIFALDTLPTIASGSTGGRDAFEQATQSEAFSATATTITINDDDRNLEDYSGGGFGNIDSGVQQTLVNDVSIGGTTYFAGTNFYAIAQVHITNTTTGESGQAIIVDFGANGFASYLTYNIAVSQGDIITYQYTDNSSTDASLNFYNTPVPLDYNDLSGGGANTSTDEIFAEYGKTGFMSLLSLAAYHLDGRENDGRWNIENPFADDAFAKIDANLDLLDSCDIPGLDTDSNRFGVNGFENGIFTKKNGAALVGRSDDALFIAFRGTNDVGGGVGTSDAIDWITKTNHFKLFKELIKGVATYVNAINSDGDSSNDITKLYVTGHSLGASMADAFMGDSVNSISWMKGLFDIPLEGITFANPGYWALPLSNSSVSSFKIKGDPVPIAGGAVANTVGDVNKIFHNIDKWGVDSSLHSMKLYSDFIDFFRLNHLDGSDFQNMFGIDFDRIYAFVKDYDLGVDSNTGNFKIGNGNDTISGSWHKEMILGGAGNDTLSGKGGKDYLDGGSGWDVLSGGWRTDYLFGRGGWDELYGGRGDDFLYAGKGSDELWGGSGEDHFVFNTIAEISNGGSKTGADRINDFDSSGAKHDFIDLREIDAKDSVGGDQKFHLKGGSFSGTEGELRITHTSGNTLVRGDTDGDGVADFVLKLTGIHYLTADHFLL